MNDRLIEHFSLLDSDRERDEIGPMIPLRVLPPWHGDRHYPIEVCRYGAGFYFRGFATFEGNGAPLDQPLARVPETMRPDEPTPSLRHPGIPTPAIRVDPDGYVYLVEVVEL